MSTHGHDLVIDPAPRGEFARSGHCAGCEWGMMTWYPGGASRIREEHARHLGRVLSVRPRGDS